MLKSKVSVRGQTVIPQEIREKLGIEPNSEVAWWIEGGTVTVVPIPADPIAASRGMLAGSGFTYQDFMEQRAQDRELDRQREERLMKQMDEAEKRRKRAG